MPAPIPKLDSDFNVIGETTNLEARANGWPRMVARICVVNESGLILLQKRSASKAIAPGLWDLAAAGHVDVGETFEIAAVRELQEEIGIVAELTLAIEYMHVVTDEDNILSNTYTCIVPDNIALTVDPAEVAEIEWVTSAELNTRITKNPENYMCSFVQAWTKYRDKLIT